MEEEVKEIKKDVKEIKDALLGTSFTGNKGMIDAVMQNTKYRRNNSKRMAFFTSLGAFFGALLTWLKAKFLGI